MGDDIAGTAFALTRSGSDAELKRDIVETHPGTRAAGVFPVRRFGGRHKRSWIGLLADESLRQL